MIDLQNQPVKPATVEALRNTPSTHSSIRSILRHIIERERERRGMGFLSHRVKRSDLEAGDHIYTWRTPVFAYSHHGIYIGGDIVVHFTQDPNLSPGNIGISSSVPNVAAPCLAFQDCRKHTSGVLMSCLNCFLGNGSLHRYEYGVRGVTLIAKLRPGTCTTAKSDPPEFVIHKAMYLLKAGFGKYDLFLNNCEDFALYCKTGLCVPGGKASGLSGQASSVAGIPVAAIISLTSKMFAWSPYVLVASTLGNNRLSMYACDIGVRDDVVKMEVENFAAVHGCLPAEEDACAKDRPEKEGSTILMDGSIDSSGTEFCGDGPCQLRLQPGDCQWFEEPCIGRVKEILIDLSSRNQSLKEEVKSAEKEYALLAKSLNEYKIACDAMRIKLQCEKKSLNEFKIACYVERMKSQCEKEMLKHDLNQLKFKFNALIVVCVLIAFLASVRLV